MSGFESSLEVKLLKFKSEYIKFKDLGLKPFFEHASDNFEKYNAFIEIIQQEIHQN